MPMLPFRHIAAKMLFWQNMSGRLLYGQELLITTGINLEIGQEMQYLLNQPM